MAFLDDADKAALIARINHAESKTRGEIMTVIARESDGYRYIPLLWAALIALSVPGLFYSWQHMVSAGWRYPGDDQLLQAWLYPLQVLIFIGLGMLFQIPRCRLWMIPRSVQHQRASRHAREQFFLQNLHQTEERTGLLIFVSVAEHYVEIIADTGIAARVDDDVWSEAVDEFVSQVRRGDIRGGFEGAIEHCREVLWEHFPAPDGRPDELPNHLIEV